MGKRITRKRYSIKSKSKRNKTKRHKTNKNTHHKFYLFGGNNILYRDNFRIMFMNNIKHLINAVKQTNKTAITKSLIKFENGFMGNRLGINNLILATMDTFKPIDKHNYSSEEYPDNKLAFFPSLVIIFENISDNKIRKKLITSFIRNGGNINLKASKKKITALSDAIKLRDKELVLFLLENGADPNTLDNVQTSEFNAFMQEPPPAEIVTPPAEIVPPPALTKIPSPKLIIPTELPPESGYPLESEPEFWKPLFGNNNMTLLRTKIHSMIFKDKEIIMIGNKMPKDKNWSVCETIKGWIPTYNFPTINNPIIPPRGRGEIIYDAESDFTNYNILLCAALLVFGIISKKMEEQDYQMIFKGGKAIQLSLASLHQTNIYESEDIDVLIMPNKDIEYNEENVKNLSGHIAYLIKWFLTVTIEKPNNNINISVLRPDPSNTRANPFIFKLSYAKIYGRFRPFSDIDFKEISQVIKPFFERSIKYQFDIPDSDEKVLFNCPDVGSLINEKLYYYSIYTHYKYLLLYGHYITDPGYENLTIDECDRLLGKFGRAILALIEGLHLQGPYSSINFISSRLENLRFNRDLIDLVIRELYPPKYSQKSYK